MSDEEDFVVKLGDPIHFDAGQVFDTHVAMLDDLSLDKVRKVWMYLHMPEQHYQDFKQAITNSFKEKGENRVKVEDLVEDKIIEMSDFNWFSYAIQIPGSQFYTFIGQANERWGFFVVFQSYVWFICGSQNDRWNKYDKFKKYELKPDGKIMIKCEEGSFLLF